MKLALTVATLVLLATTCVLGAILHHQHRLAHPSFVLAPGIENADDVLVALQQCKTSATWNVELHKGAPEQLVMLTCPKEVHLKIDKDDAGSPLHWPERQFLVLERQSGHRVDVLTARFADSNIRRVEPGQNEHGEQAVLWSFMNRCASCHSGPEGVLLWNTHAQRYEWNDRFPEPIEKALDAELAKQAPADVGDTSLDEQESLFWDETRTSITLRGVLHGTGAHCCPNGGEVSAELPFDGGVLTITGITYRAQSPPVASPT